MGAVHREERGLLPPGGIMTAGEAMSEVSLGTTLGELVAGRPGRGELFERLRFDYCCGGAKSLRKACRERGLDPDTIREPILSQDAAVADDLPGPLVKPHPSGGALPACCQGWLGEQVHRTFRRAARSKEVPCR